MNTNEDLRARHIMVLRQLMPDVDDDAVAALSYAIAALARQEEGAPASPQGVSEEMVTAAIRRYLELEPGEKEVGGVTPESTETRRFVRELLEAAFGTAAGAAPEGWVLVPREPTLEQEKAGNAALPDRMRQVFGDLSFAHYVYKAMLAATPNPGAQHGQEGRDG